MKRIIATVVLGMFLLGSILAANVFKFTFTDVAFPDGRVGTIRASVKTTKKDAVTLFDFTSNPNDQSLGQFQGTDNTSTDAAVVRDYCLAHYGERQ